MRGKNHSKFPSTLCMLPSLHRLSQNHTHACSIPIPLCREAPPLNLGPGDLNPYRLSWCQLSNIRDPTSSHGIPAEPDPLTLVYQAVLFVSWMFTFNWCCVKIKALWGNLEDGSSQLPPISQRPSVWSCFTSLVC